MPVQYPLYPITMLITSLCSRYPGPDHVAGKSKIPSLLYYDRNGTVMAAGAEAEATQILAQAEDEEWTKVELYVS